MGRAKHMRLSKSSAAPWMSLAMKSALAGAIRMASASRLRLMCGIWLSTPALGRLSHCEVNTERPDRACIVTGVMNCSAAALMTTCTVAPALTKARHSSAAL